MDMKQIIETPDERNRFQTLVSLEIMCNRPFDFSFGIS
jgi:hypothetical protein